MGSILKSGYRPAEPPLRTRANASRLGGKPPCARVPVRGRVAERAQARYGLILYDLTKKKRGLNSEQTNHSDLGRSRRIGTRHPRVRTSRMPTIPLIPTDEEDLPWDLMISCGLSCLW